MTHLANKQPWSTRSTTAAPVLSTDLRRGRHSPQGAAGHARESLCKYQCMGILKVHLHGKENKKLKPSAAYDRQEMDAPRVNPMVTHQLFCVTHRYTWKKTLRGRKKHPDCAQVFGLHVRPAPMSPCNPSQWSWTRASSQRFTTGLPPPTGQPKRSRSVEQKGPCRGPDTHAVPISGLSLGQLQPGPAAWAPISGWHPWGGLHSRHMDPPWVLWDLSRMQTRELSSNNWEIGSKFMFLLWCQPWPWPRLEFWSYEPGETSKNRLDKQPPKKTNNHPRCVLFLKLP